MVIDSLIILKNFIKEISLSLVEMPKTPKQADIWLSFVEFGVSCELWSTIVSESTHWDAISSLLVSQFNEDAAIDKQICKMIDDIKFCNNFVCLEDILVMNAYLIVSLTQKIDFILDRSP